MNAADVVAAIYVLSGLAIMLVVAVPLRRK